MLLISDEKNKVGNLIGINAIGDGDANCSQKYPLFSGFPAFKEELTYFDDKNL
jgi:hypothetical protein